MKQSKRPNQNGQDCTNRTENSLENRTNKPAQDKTNQKSAQNKKNGQTFTDCNH